MSNIFSNNSTELYHKLYGSISSKEIKESKVITEPEIIYFENRINKESNNENDENGQNNNYYFLADMPGLKDEISSKYEIIKNLMDLGDEKDNINANFISELSNDYIIISTYDKHLIFFNKQYKKILKIIFPFQINSFNEVKSKENDNIIKLLCFSIFCVYEISLYLSSKDVKIDICTFSKKIIEGKKEENKSDKNNETKSFNYHFMSKLNNNKELLCTNNGVYEGENILNKKENSQEPILLGHYTESIVLSNRLICFKSNKQLTKGEDSLTIFDINTQKIINKINGYSFSICPYRSILLIHNEKKKTLICGCSKYSSDQKNGILLVNFDLDEDENMKNIKTNIKFEETDYFSLDCICFLKNNKEESDNKEGYLLAGGVDEEYNKGVIKLYKINCGENEIDIEYLQDLELDENIEGNISYIYQLKNGKIIISCTKGNFLFTEPNLEGYTEDSDNDL